MNADSHDIIKQVLMWLVPCLPAIILHECAHGWMALCLGDPTARDAKRLSVNPLRHIDPMGTLILPGFLLLVHSSFIFGWAKPIPVNFSRLRHGRGGVFLVALAGPLANLIMMAGWLGIVVFIESNKIMAKMFAHSTVDYLGQVAFTGVAINLVLILFNLIPIPPLDGGRLVGALLPPYLSRYYMRLERFGILIFFLLLITGAFHRIFDPLLDYMFSTMLSRFDM
jgi:Zn-dependent protease